ncbi:major facilitator superfamily domain-containing protein 6 isoform X2 [Agrilus planipennis]|uniref:Major facilitator superfamily domain-containing protein 6 isoform X2 n=1 Tax=Agrilus planipennis TaxID=224129 RepID=A0A1W4WEF1_AGRPL|nr:major facilitator superfamily domain-containing protein 6 isoform X2 [Agrilus planipennis]
MKLNKELLPIKAHFFFFMAAMGPILPQLPVYGKELGISSVVMGTVSGILPILFLLAKPVFGIIVDVFRSHRKSIFMVLIAAMSTSFAFLYALPNKFGILDFKIDNITCREYLRVCDDSNISCKNSIKNVTCVLTCPDNSMSNRSFKGLAYLKDEEDDFTICKETFIDIDCSKDCKLRCQQNSEIDAPCFYNSSTFWGFILLMSLGNICYNVANSISDAVCFDVIGDTYDYGKQRVWGAIGFGLTALLGGYLVDWWSIGSFETYTPAFIIMVSFTLIDLFACSKLKLPVISPPKNVFKDLCRLLRDRDVVVFLIFAIFAGIIDSFIIYFLFWFLEDLAIQSQTGNVKLLEGLIVAAETLGGEILFFAISGKILSKIGYANCFSICFVNYSIRLLLISLAPNPWWILPVELVMQGPTYALTYTTIVAYANAISPPGMSATMQGIAAVLSTF